jgi:hypothetical protein
LRATGGAGRREPPCRQAPWRTKNGGDEAALSIEHDDRLKAVFVVMRIEQPQLLPAMDRVERVVDVKRDPFGNPLERFAIEIDHGATHAQQGTSIGQIFKTRDRRLRTQFAIRRREIERHLEYGIAAKTGGVVAVFIARRDHQQPKPNDIGQRVRDLIGRATRRRCSTSRKTTTPPSDDSSPPSNLATIVLPKTGDRPGSGSIGSAMAG